MKIVSYRGFVFEDFGFAVGMPFGVPFLSAAPQVLTRPGASPTFGPGTVTERAIPVQFIVNRTEYGSFEAAYDILMQRIHPTDTSPGELVAERLDGTIVSIQAVLVLPPGSATGEIDTLNGTFIAVDPMWQAETETVIAKTFSLGADLAMNVPITGTIQQEPVIVISPTVQRASSTTTSGERFRMTYRITNNLSRSLVGIPYRIDLGDTATKVAAGKMQADGDDIRLVVDGKEIPRTLVGMNTASTGAWIEITNLAAGRTMDVDVLYGGSSMTAPQTLDASLASGTLPAINLTTSTNLVWKYDVAELSANAGKGAFLLSSGTSIPAVNTDAPGAWRFFTLTTGSRDSTWQEKYTEFNSGGTDYYVAKLNAIRARQAAIPAESNYVDADGLMLNHPGGITQVRADVKWLNEYQTGTSGDPVGRVGIFASDDGSNWRVVQQWSTPQTTVASVAVANYNVSPSALFVGFATKPYRGTSVPTTAKAARQASIEWDTTLEVTVGGASIAQSTIQTEEAIYEIAMSLRVGGDADLDGPYNIVRIGGAASRRLVMRLDENLVIDTKARTVEVWNAAEDTLVATIPVFALDARQVLEYGGSEGAAQKWLPMATYINPLNNHSLLTDASGWSRVSVGTGVTANAPARSTDFSDTSLRSQITASTGASGIAAVVERNDDFLEVPADRVAMVAADLRTTVATLVPRLTIWFYDAAFNLVGSASMESLYTPPTGSFFRRVHQVTAPQSRIKYYRVGVTAWTTAANVTGSIYSTRYVPDGNELIIRDDAIGTLSVEVRYLPLYL